MTGESRARLKTSFLKAEDSPGFMLWKAANLMQRLHSNCLKDLNITPTQFSVMTCIVYLSQQQPITSSAVVAHTGMDKMMVSDLVKTLLKKGYIRKKVHPEDGRSFLISATAMGSDVVNKAVRRIEEFDTQFFAACQNLSSFHADLVSLVLKNQDKD